MDIYSVQMHEGFAHLASETSRTGHALMATFKHVVTHIDDHLQSKMVMNIWESKVPILFGKSKTFCSVLGL